MVVMPSVYNSAYTDMKYGLDYFSYLTEELTDFVERNFRQQQSGKTVLLQECRWEVTVPINGDLPVRKNLRQSEALRDLTMRISLSGKG